MSSTVAILLPDLRGGGVERIRLELAREFSAAGYEVEFVLLRARGELLCEASRQFPIRELGCDSLRKCAIPLIAYLRSVKPAALLVAMWPLTVIGPAAVLASGHRCRVITSEHNTLSKQYSGGGIAKSLVLRTSLAIGLRLADARVAVSRGVALDVARLGMFPAPHVEVIYNPLSRRSDPSLEEIASADALWTAVRGHRILSVGSLKDQKNHALLLRAFAQLHCPEARLMLLGQGQNERSLRQLAEELRISDRVIFAGFRDNPSAFYATADVFALSSNYEGFGNVIVEALAFGLPVVSTNCPSGPAEILEDGRWGRLVPTGNAELLADAIKASLTEPVDRENLRGRAAAFTLRAVAKRYIELLFRT